MRGCAGGLALLVAVAIATPDAARAQVIVDLAGAWGDDERTIDGGGGVGVYGFALVVGVAAVEHGLDPRYRWSPAKTRVIDTVTGQQVDPRVARTKPWLRGWARLEFQPSWWGGALMWDPRNHPAIGAFGEVNLAPRSYAVGEVRWVHTIGHLLAFRLRFR